MRYRLIGENDYLLSPVATVLNNRGIEDIENFLNVSEKHVNSWRLLKNIDKAVECLLKHLNQKSKIYIQIDPDADGNLSSSVLINYIKRVYPQADIVWGVHEGKNHGVVLDNVPNEAKLVIIPDAGSNQYREHKILSKQGKDVIVLDHHLCEEESKYAIVVNNQLSPDYPNKSFSGCGIVYKFCQALDEILDVNHADYFLDLVAIGNAADSMDLRELETRFYVLKGLKKINNPLLKELFKKQEFSTKGIINITTVLFYIAPLINATIRVGSLEEKINMMKAFLESEAEIYNQKKKEYEPIAVAMARIMSNVKARQNRMRDKALTLIEERIKERSLNKNKVLIVNVTDILDKNLTGLVANQLAGIYKRPCLLIRQHEDDTFGGSGRGYDKYEVKDLRQLLLGTECFNFCEGHPEAFGINIHKNNIIKVNEILNKNLSHIMNEDVYEVDFIISADQLNIGTIKEINQMRDAWGNTVSEPLLAIKNLTVNTDEMNNGTKKNILKFNYKNIEFVKFKFTEEEFAKITQSGNVTMDLIVKCSVNEYNGQITQQLIIEDYLITNKGKKEFVF